MTIAFIVGPVKPVHAGHPVITGRADWQHAWETTGSSDGACHRAGHFGPDPLADDDTGNDRKDAQFARPQMPTAGAAHQKSARRLRGGGRSSREMNRSASRHRHPEFAEPDRRYARSGPKRKEGPDFSDSKKMMTLTRHP